MKKVMAVVLMMAVLLIACSKEKADDIEGKDNSIGSKTEPETETEEQDNTYPFTGIHTSEKVNQRPIAVMVNNHPNARPQSGLSQADIVFEILAEGNITRFLAIYQSEQPEIVGPVRSAREYYFDLAERYDAIYVYHGAANFVEDMIEKRGVEHINGSIHDNDGYLFKRESFRKAPHNSYLQFTAVNETLEQKGYETTTAIDPLPFLEEEEANQIEGESAEHLKIAYSSSKTVEYDYNQDSESYDRFSDGERTIELNTENPIQVENLLIIEAHHQVIDEEGRRAIDLESGGEAYFVQKGKIQNVEWENMDGRIIPVKDDHPVHFTPGNTWINVIPANPGLEQAVTISSH